MTATFFTKFDPNHHHLGLNLSKFHSVVKYTQRVARSVKLDTIHRNVFGDAKHLHDDWIVGTVNRRGRGGTQSQFVIRQISAILRVLSG